MNNFRNNEKKMATGRQPHTPLELKSQRTSE